ncbi:inorganic pyrophosphatase [Pantoea agglomerans]
MSLNQVPAGKDLPEDIYVVIEIPANADPIKYEVDKESGALFVDRFHVYRHVLSVQLRLHQPYPFSGW